MAAMHGEWSPLVCLGVTVLWVVGMRMASMQMSEELELLLGDAVLLALTNAHITVKDAAALMKIDESNLRHALRGEKGHHLSLNRLEELPFAFWLRFMPYLAHRVAHKHLREIAEDLRLTLPARRMSAMAEDALKTKRTA